jgi:hypothetical protein
MSRVTSSASPGGSGPRFPLPRDLPEGLLQPVALLWPAARALRQQWLEALDTADQTLRLIRAPGRAVIPFEVDEAWRCDLARLTLERSRSPADVADVAALCELGREVVDWFVPGGQHYHRDVEFTLYRRPHLVEGVATILPHTPDPVPVCTDSPLSSSPPTGVSGCRTGGRTTRGSSAGSGTSSTGARRPPTRSDGSPSSGTTCPIWCRDESGGRRDWVVSQIASRRQGAIRLLSRGLGVKPITLPADRPFAEVLDHIEGWVVEAGARGRVAAGESARGAPGRSAPPPADSWSRLLLEPAGCLVRLDGQCFGPIDPTAFLMFRLLCDARGGLVPGKSIAKAVRDEYGRESRPDRVRKKLPDALGKLIRADTGKGYWLILPPLPQP